MKRFFALILVLIMVCSVMLSCKKEEESEETSAATTVASDNGKIDNLPDNLDFGGMDINILYRYLQDQSFDNMIMELEGDMSGNLLNQAVYQRNQAVEKRLNVKIVYDAYAGNPDQPTYKKSIESIVLSDGDGSNIDVIYHHGADAANQANQGYFMDVGNLPYIEIDQPYWYGEQMKSVSLKEDENYLLIGELLTSNYANMTSMFFNKDLYDQIYNKDSKTYNDLYDTVEAGNWTYEAYLTTVEKAYVDDGNQDKNLGDQFGAHYESGSGRTGGYYPYTSGIKFCTRDSEGFIQLDFDQPKTLTLIEEMYSFVNENKGTMDMSYDEARQTFLEGKMLFYTFFLSHGAILNAEASFNYGVVPFPKLDENCDYTSAVLTGAGVYVIPKFLASAKFEAVGATLEALCSESSKSVTSEYYDVIIKTRQAGGERDAKMIDIIRDSLSTDFTFWCGASIGRPNNVFKTLVITNNSKDFVSYWQSFGGSYEAQLDIAIQAYKDAR